MRAKFYLNAKQVITFCNSELKIDKYAVTIYDNH